MTKRSTAFCKGTHNYEDSPSQLQGVMYFQQVELMYESWRYSSQILHLTLVDQVVGIMYQNVAPRTIGAQKGDYCTLAICGPDIRTPSTLQEQEQ